MKKLIFAVIIVVIISFPARAASYTSHADTLNALGVFRRTDVGYELDATATRAQAAVMLVRLLGQEQNAETQANTHPFTDVPDWASAAVGYLYANKLTNGTGATTFEPDLLCTSQMYTTFALRALGYSEQGSDFAYADAVKFGTEKLLVNDTLALGDFTRDKMVAVSYNALLANLNGESSRVLLEKLNADGVVNKDAADKLLARFATLNEFNAAYAAAMEKLAKADSFGAESYITGSGTLTFEDGEREARLTAVRKMNVADELRMSLEAATTVGEEKSSRRMYAKDGAMYFSLPAANGRAQNIKIAADGANNAAQTNENSALLPSDFGQDFKKASKDGNMVFTLTVSGTTEENPAVLQLLDSLIAFPELDVKSAAVSVSYTFDGSGALTGTDKSGNIISETVYGGKPALLDLKFTSAERTADAVAIAFPSELNSYADVTNQVNAG